MRLLSLFVVLAFCFLPVLGCGGNSGSGDAVAEQDELGAYLEEHGDDTDLDAGEE